MEYLTPFTPIFANAFQFAMEKATLEGKITIGILVVVSMFSWTVIFTKSLQLYKASKMSKKFFAGYRSTRDPLEMFNKKQEFPGSPAYEIYYAGTEELAYHLKNNPVEVKKEAARTTSNNNVPGVQTDTFARAVTVKISNASFESVKVALERSVSAQAISLEKGMIILTTAVAGGPFIGLLAATGTPRRAPALGRSAPRGRRARRGWGKLFWRNDGKEDGCRRRRRRRKDQRGGESHPASGQSGAAKTLRLSARQERHQTIVR